MKRILALLLAMIMILSLCACGNNTADNTDGGTTENTESSTTDTEGTTESTSSIDGTEGTTESTSSIDGTEASTEDIKPTEKPTEQTKPTEPTKPTENTEPTEEPTKPTESTPPIINDGTHEHTFTLTSTTLTDCDIAWVEYYVCSCGTIKTVQYGQASHQWSEWETTKEPTYNTTGTAARSCNRCGKTESKTLDKKSPYYISHEIVSKTLPNAHYIGGVDMLTKMFGANTALQTGDSVTYKINMSDGGSKGFSIYGTAGCTATVNGNQITMKITGEYRSANMAIKTVDKNGNEKIISIVYSYVVQYDGDITKSNWRMEDLLHDYARIKHGIAYDSQINFEEGYTSDRANDPSITGAHGDGTFDDYFVKSEKSDWVEYTMWLISEYKKIGIKSIKCTVTNNYFGAVASKN